MKSVGGGKRQLKRGDPSRKDSNPGVEKQWTFDPACWGRKNGRKARTNSSVRKTRQSQRVLREPEKRMGKKPTRDKLTWSWRSTARNGWKAGKCLERRVAGWREAGGPGPRKVKKKKLGLGFEQIQRGEKVGFAKLTLKTSRKKEKEGPG